MELQHTNYWLRYCLTTKTELRWTMSWSLSHKQASSDKFHTIHTWNNLRCNSLLSASSDDQSVCWPGSNCRAVIVRNMEQISRHYPDVKRCLITEMSPLLKLLIRVNYLLLWRLQRPVGTPVSLARRGCTSAVPGMGGRVWGIGVY